MTSLPETLAEYHASLNAGIIPERFSQKEAVTLFAREVPVDYARTLNPTYAADIVELYEFSIPVEYAAPFVKLRRRDMDCIIRCHRHDVPVEYATALYDHRRSWAIVELHDAGVPAEYVLSFDEMFAADTIIDGYRRGVAPEYLHEVFS